MKNIRTNSCFRPFTGCGLLHRPGCGHSKRCAQVSVPLRGVDCYLNRLYKNGMTAVSVPLRGVDCYNTAIGLYVYSKWFPSLYGVWIATNLTTTNDRRYDGFPSLYGVWIATNLTTTNDRRYDGFPSLYGVWIATISPPPQLRILLSFRPFTGCGLLPRQGR